MERLHGERFETIRQAKDAVLAWLLWYNRNRMHSTLNTLSPVEFERRWREQQLQWLPHENRRQPKQAAEIWKSIKADFHIPTATTTTTR